MNSRGTALALAGRNLLLMRRIPSVVVPSLVFPIFLVIAFSGAYGALTMLPGFPVDNMIDWILPMAVVQSAAFGGVNVGLSVVRDLQGGFFDRLLLAPVSRLGLVAGPILGAVVRAFVPLAVVLATGLVAGARLRGGPAGLLTLLVAAEGVAVIAAGWGVGLALRLRDQRAAPLMQVGIFLAVFLSTAQVPLAIMSGWLRTVATLNPMTSILALGRQGFIGPVTWAQTWPGLVALAGGMVVLCAFAVRGLADAEQ
ncbi:MAG: ABC transporter permease [Actinobacteria bacterium]|nr:ABC transporter permease [Actinomycetota bacterium]